MIEYYAGKRENVRYKLSEKKDKCVVLLHGYLETLEVWGDFYDLLKEQFTVLSLDLPGHGESSFSGEPCMEYMAECVHDLLTYLEIERVYVVGHSMGGYVANSFTLMYPEMVDGHVLFHSNTFADTQEKKGNREKEIGLIGNGKLPLICANSIPNTFGANNVALFEKEISNILTACLKHKPEGIISCLRAMILRKDTTFALKEQSVPIFSIIGARDKFISLETAQSLVYELGAVSCILENSGHMGFIEEKQCCVEVLSRWIENN